MRFKKRIFYACCTFSCAYMQCFYSLAYPMTFKKHLSMINAIFKHRWIWPRYPCTSNNIMTKNIDALSTRNKIWPSDEVVAKAAILLEKCLIQTSKWSRIREIWSQNGGRWSHSTGGRRLQVFLRTKRICACVLRSAIRGGHRTHSSFYCTHHGCCWMSRKQMIWAASWMAICRIMDRIGKKLVRETGGGSRANSG